MKRFKRHLSAFWGNVLDMLLPMHAKRIVYLATLYTYMTGKVIDEEADLKELNEALTLATTSKEAIIIPANLTKWIWKGNGIGAQNWPEEKLRRRFVERCPCWLNYGRELDLMEDIHKLQKFVAASS